MQEAFQCKALWSVLTFLLPSIQNVTIRSCTERSIFKYAVSQTLWNCLNIWILKLSLISENRTFIVIFALEKSMFTSLILHQGRRHLSVMQLALCWAVHCHWYFVSSVVSSTQDVVWDWIINRVGHKWLWCKGSHFSIQFFLHAWIVLRLRLNKLKEVTV